MTQNFTTDTIQWQGVDDEPTAESNNLVKSGGVYNSLNTIYQYLKNKVDKKITGESINIFDKNNAILNNGFIYSDGTISNLSNCRYTSINIKPNTTYAFYAIPYSSGIPNCIYCRFLDEDGNILKPLNPETGTELSFQASPNRFIKSPATAIQFEFTVIFISGTDYNVNILDSIMVIETTTAPIEYIPYDLVVPKESLSFDVDAWQEEIDKINEKADLIKITRKNLFNPANCILNRRMNYSIVTPPQYPNITFSTNSLISGFIPIEGGETYYYHGGDVSSTGSQNSEQSINFFDEDFNPLYCLNPETDEPYGVGNQKPNNAYKAPINAKYACFCLIWFPADSEPTLIDYGFQLEKGN